MAVEEGLGSVARHVEGFLAGPAGQRREWCALVALSEALVPGGAEEDEEQEQEQEQGKQHGRAPPPPSLQESPEALAFVLRQLEEGYFAVGDGGGEGGSGRLQAVVRELVSGCVMRMNLGPRFPSKHCKNHPTHSRPRPRPPPTPNTHQTRPRRRRRHGQQHQRPGHRRPHRPGHPSSGPPPHAR